VLAQVHSQAAMDVFEKDCLILLGTVVAPKGKASKGKPCFRYTISGTTLNKKGELPSGSLELLPLGIGEKAEILLEPFNNYDLGAGPGKPINKTIEGGLVGLILDARGRPLSFSNDVSLNMNMVNDWIEELGLYPKIDIPQNDGNSNTGPIKTSEKAHAYTPGLEVSYKTVHSMQRVLPIPGKVTVNKGESVLPEQVIAETYMPGDIFPLNLANQLSMPPADVPECVTVSIGDEVCKGDVLAETKGIFGMFKSIYRSPNNGTVETISDITGQIIIRGEEHPVNVMAFMPGKVIKIIKDQGVVIESKVSLIQGIFGIGGESFGEIVVACKSHDETVNAEHITENMKNSVIIGGGRMTSEAIQKAIDIGASGLISGGIDDQDLKEILGYDLGVAITGSEKLGLTLIVTEGFGDIAMAERTFKLFKSREGKKASINGATQIRAGVIRPSIIIPVDEISAEESIESDYESGILEVGSSVRIIRDPYFGEIGTVHSLPSNPQILESGTKTRVLEVLIESGNILTIPRANIELIEGDGLT